LFYKKKYQNNQLFQKTKKKSPNHQPVSQLKPYVKCYLRPDATKATKKKVQALFNGAYPIFTETVNFYCNIFFT
jgi:hypothetical protein